MNQGHQALLIRDQGLKNWEQDHKLISLNSIDFMRINSYNFVHPGSDSESVHMHRLHGSEMNRFPDSNKGDQEPGLRSAFNVQFNDGAWPRDNELLPKVSQVSPSQGRGGTISIPKGTTGRRDKAQGSPRHASSSLLDLNPKTCGPLCLRQQGAGPIGSHRTTLKLNTSREANRLSFPELMALWAFNCRDLLARCNVCGYAAVEEPVTIAVSALSRPLQRPRL
jgi:hypothetical protein